MYQSRLFTKTRKEAPKDEVSKNAQLLIRAGYIQKEMAGVYVFLPLGLRVLNNIMSIIREEMNAIGGQEILMSSLQNPELWKKTNRWDDNVVDNWFKTKLAHNGTELGLGFTHEEPIAQVMASYVSSYRDLPRYTYQFQTKFRNETRAKSGIMRTREFIMKDLYSFSRTQEELDAFYNSCAEAYKRIFARAGIGKFTHFTFASGGVFSKYSHEFQAVSEAGEDIIYVDEKSGIAINQEVYTDDVINSLGLSKQELVEKKSIEVGNIFKLGTKYSEPLGLTFKDEKGENNPVLMGSYGIGPARLMGTIVELLSDENGIIWPQEVAPFQVHLVSLGMNETAESVYQLLTKQGVSTLFDDREIGAGEKFADSDLMGIPYRIVISKKTQGQHQYELKERSSEQTNMIEQDSLISFLKTKLS